MSGLPRAPKSRAVLPATLSCPTCKRPVLVAAADRPASFPFCSNRCRLLDLGAWADGKHAIEGRPIDQVLEDQDCR